MDRCLIPAARRADWYARGVGGATEHAKEGAAREINKIPAARRLIEESMFRTAGITAPLRPLPSSATGLPRLRNHLSRRAAPLTPVDRSRCICRLLAQIVLPSPNSGRLSTRRRGPAPTTSLSRPAQASHKLRPVDSLPYPRQGLSQGFDTASYPAAPPASYRANRPLPRWDLHPRGDRAIRGAPEFHEDARRRIPGGEAELTRPAIRCGWIPGNDLADHCSMCRHARISVYLRGARRSPW
jgi:hypothetical protein